MTDRVSSRRTAASSFFLAAQSALVVLVGSTSTQDWALALPGLIVALTWWLLLRSYRLLNAAKFNVIQAMEEQLPVAPFRDEWAELKPEQGMTLTGRYFELGVLERVVPAIFGIIFLVVLFLEIL